MQQLSLILLFIHQKKISSDNTAIFSNITELILGNDQLDTHLLYFTVRLL